MPPILIPPLIAPAPVRTPLIVNGKQVVMKENTPWEKLFEVWYTALYYLLTGPQSLAGVVADLPDPTLLAEGTTYWATDTHEGYIVIFATPGDSSTAVWTLTVAVLVSNAAYGPAWNGVAGVAPSQNAVYDKIEAVIAAAAALISDTAYGAGWDADTTHGASKNALYDKIQTLLTIGTGFLWLYGQTTANGALKGGTDGGGLGIVQVRLGDDSAYGDLWVLDSPYAAGWNGNQSVPTKNAVYDKMETKADAQAPGAHTIPLAKLTALGTNGSLTWNAQGVITGYVDPT